MDFPSETLLIPNPASLLWNGRENNLLIKAYNLMIPVLNILTMPFVNLHLTECHILFIIPNTTLGLNSVSTKGEEAKRCAWRSDCGDPVANVFLKSTECF